jgi:hypothetical protein
MVRADDTIPQESWQIHNHQFRTSRPLRCPIPSKRIYVKPVFNFNIHIPSGFDPIP